MKRTFAIWMIISIVAALPAKAQHSLAYLDKKKTQKSAGSNVLALTDFTVVMNQDKPHLYWRTGESADYNYFEVQRTEDGLNFKTVALFFAKEDAKPHELYNYKDASATPDSKSYAYRLRIVGSKGESVFTEVKKVQADKN